MKYDLNARCTESRHAEETAHQPESASRVPPILSISPSVPRRHLNTQSTTSDRNHSPQIFHIAHPFHLLYGQAFELVQVRSNWGEERAYYVDANEQLLSADSNAIAVCHRRAL